MDNSGFGAVQGKDFADAGLHKREFGGIHVESTRSDVAYPQKSFLVSICQNFAVISAQRDAFPLLCIIYDPSPSFPSPCPAFFQ